MVSGKWKYKDKQSQNFPFEKLEVYQVALQFALTAQTLTSEIKRMNAWANQFARASMSIPLNIAEGSGRQSAPDKRNFYIIDYCQRFCF